MKLKIKTLAEIIATTNSMVWDSMCAVENLLSHPIIESILNDEDYMENKELIKLAKAYLQIELEDEEFANPENVGSEWAKFHTFASRFEDLLMKVEGEGEE